MIVDVLVPQIGEAVSELTIVEWFKAVGDNVTEGETIFSIDSEKAVVDVEATYNGTITEILAEADATVTPGDIVARIECADG